MVYLLLEDGSVFEGQGFGADVDSIGEVVFNTCAGCYENIITDPAYNGQTVVMTYPLIGNYGMNNDDLQSKKAQIRGLIVREICDEPNNFKCEYTVDKFLKDNNVCGIAGVDTRAITRKIRDNGTMLGIITKNRPTAETQKKFVSYKAGNLVNEVTCETEYVVECGKQNAKTVGVLDLGVKKCLIKMLTSKGVNVKVYPASTTAEKILSDNIDGVVISGGPGNPKECGAIVETVKALLGKKAIFGIDLGHLILALANDCEIQKLPFGHHGANQPIKNVETGNIYISTANHLYAVNEKSVKKGKITFVNINDNSVQGIKYDKGNAFGVQFCAEEFSGPRNTTYLFDEFISLFN